MAIVNFDPSVLLNYYLARLPLGRAAAPAQSTAGAERPPWDLAIPTPKKERADVEMRGGDPYFDPKDAALLAKAASASNANSQLEAILNKALAEDAAPASALAADNHKLFALYQALNRLSYIAKMATREETTKGLLPGLDADFQDGLSQVRSFVGKASFDGLAVMTGIKAASVQSSAVVPYAPYNYAGKGVVQHSGWAGAVPGVTAADSFTVSIAKGGVTTDVVIDLANVAGTLSLDNIDAYVNQQLAAAGFSTKFARVQTGGSVTDDTATWGIRIDNAASETVTLSSSQAKTALYLAGTSGAPAAQQGRLVKLGGLDATPTSVFAAAIAPEGDKTATAKSAAIDSEGNVYVVGDTTGDFGSQLNQATSDVYLTKYDSAGKVLWTRLLGSAGSASGFSVAAAPGGGVIVAGSVTGDLSAASIGGGADSFAAKYDSEGNQSWLHQAAPLSNDSALGVAVDASGNVYLAGKVSGVITSGEINAGGTDAYVTKLSSAGSLVYHRQFGTAGEDWAAQIAVAADGGLIVASMENSRAIVRKFDSADGDSAALWEMDLGDIQTGGLGGITLSGDQVYVSGSTTNASLDAAGAATIANASSGGSEAFVFNLTDSGASASAGFVTYAGTTGSEQGGGVTVAGGKLYLTGTTTGTFPGETRAEEGAHNMFAAEFGAAGALNWTRQFTGIEGQSKGLAIAADDNGASVLDALGLPRGKIALNQSSAIESQTTARAGDYFTLKIEDHTGTRTAKITLAKGETLRTLAIKINGALLFAGKARALPTTGGQRLKIEVEEGVKVELIAGAKDFDALAGLGLQPQILVNDSKDSNEAKAGPPVVGLGIAAKLDLLSDANARHANVVLMAAMALIKQAYSELNTPPGQSAATVSGPVPAYLRAQLANYQTALAWLNSGR